MSRKTVIRRPLPEGVLFPAHRPLVLPPNYSTYCGPAALSAITGHPVEMVTEGLLAARRSRLAVGGTSVMSRGGLFRKSDLTKIVATFNYEMHDYALKQADMYHVAAPFRLTTDRAPGAWGLTFAAWLRRSRLYRLQRPHIRFLVSLGRSAPHVIAVAGRQFVDNNLRNGCHVDDAPYKRARIFNVVAYSVKPERD